MRCTYNQPPVGTQLVARANNAAASGADDSPTVTVEKTYTDRNTPSGTGIIFLFVPSFIPENLGNLTDKSSPTKVLLNFD